MKRFNLILSSDDDVLIEGDCIEDYLSKKLNLGPDVYFKRIKKRDSLEISKEDLDDLKESIIYVVNTHKNMNEITYWELGYAMGKGLKVIGYLDENSSMEITSDVKRLISPIPENIQRFLEKIDRFVDNLVPQKVSVEINWEEQNKPAVNEQRRLEE